MKFLRCLLAFQFLVLLLGRDVSSLSINNEDIEANVIDKRNPASKKSSEQCGKNELYNTCASGCERSCDDVNNDDRSSGERCASPAVCAKRCVCRESYVRDKSSNGKCIRVQECPRVKH
ncbi:chymotrypsin inhibitor Ani s 6-like [Phymastichus coffea]|uniref:chymotrypsin inhibitor Ani s 6-like n=1 Tax=Phymastichus coffea TaxID=108790 RepID=UPI00273B4561|nr:chymotrypsin inhibitor Ani s 6-like [Phymastichus coffea]